MLETYQDRMKKITQKQMLCGWITMFVILIRLCLFCWTLFPSIMKIYLYAPLSSAPTPKGLEYNNNSYLSTVEPSLTQFTCILPVVIKMDIGQWWIITRKSGIHYSWYHVNFVMCFPLVSCAFSNVTKWPCPDKYRAPEWTWFEKLRYYFISLKYILF